MLTPLQEHLLSQGDWRHPGVYAIAHLPTGLEYVGASSNVLKRVKGHLTRWQSWQPKLAEIIGTDPSPDDIVPLWLETCEQQAEQLRAAEEHHYRSRKPALNATHYCPYGQNGLSSSVFVPKEKLKAPPRPFTQDGLGQVKIQLAITTERNRLDELDAEAKSRTAQTRRLLSRVIREMAYERAAEQYRHKVFEAIHEVDSHYDRYTLEHHAAQLFCDQMAKDFGLT